MRFRFACLTLVAFWLSSCGTMAIPITTPLEKSPSIAVGGDLEGGRPGSWTLEYTGECAGRESETIQVTGLGAAELLFDDFHLRRNTEGVFEGSADFIAPMPADGRDVVYTIDYALRLTDDGKFAGSETITEGGGHSLGCSVELYYVGG
ncbi:MAG: hypothetical protein OXN94_15065 [Chloroflexota bacterium]|nr:hypothetical protein [Chloroflexota bacterium]